MKRTRTFFTVICKQITGAFRQCNNPSDQELRKDLQTYPLLYLFSNLEDARSAAVIFFHPAHPPKTGGSYGLIAEVQLDSTESFHNSTTDLSIIYNNWVCSQKLNYSTLDHQNISYQCALIAPEKVTAILRTYIPEEAKAYNPNLHDTDFTIVTSPQCRLL